MASCVSSGEQDELVVRTGLELRLRRLDMEKLQTNHIYVIGGTHTIRMNCFNFLCKKLNIPPHYYYSTEYINSNSTGNPEDWYSSTSKYTKITLLESIRGIPVGYRTKGTLICFGNLSYDDKQCLYHLFGGKHPFLKTYRMFVDMMEETQKNGDAIVLTTESIMWFPGPKPEFPAEEIYKFADIDFTLDVPLMSIYKVNDIPESVQAWILKTYPQTKYVNIQMVDGKEHTYHMWGWNEAPVGSSGSQKADWWQYIEGIKKSDAVVPSLVRLKKQADEFNKKYSTSLEEQLVIVCAPTAKYFSDWVNMAEKLIKRLEKEKVYPSILIPGVGNTQHRLSYSSPYLSTRCTWNFDVEREWNSSIVFAWLIEMRMRGSKHGLTEPKTEAAAFQESVNAIKPTLKVQEEPDMKAQVAALTDTVKALTEVVAKLAAATGVNCAKT